MEDARSVGRDDADLSSFLELGFFPGGAPSIEIDLSGVDPEAQRGVPDDELIARHASALREAVRARFDPRRDHVVPLSGGLDSRALVAALLEVTEARSITTCTFGTPGTLDYDLGCAVAARAGTRHERFDLTAHRYDLEELVDASRRFRHQTIVFHHPPLREWRARYGGCVIWSGFLGDKLAKPPARSAPDQGAAERFLAEHRYVRSVRLARGPEADVLAALRIAPEERTRLELEEELNLRFRQQRFIAPHVLPLGFEFATPFAAPEMVRTALGVPPERRRGGRLYRAFLRSTFPGLFSLPTKNLLGLPLGAAAPRVFARRVRRRASRWLRRPDAMLNYLDFGRAFREREDLRAIAVESLADLGRRGLVDWIELDALWRRHQDGADHSDALIVLVSLEVRAKAGAPADRAARAAA